jgi:GDP-D-mannose dehydratase
MSGWVGVYHTKVLLYKGIIVKGIIHTKVLLNKGIIRN